MKQPKCLTVNYDDKKHILSMLGPARKWGNNNPPARRIERLCVHGDYPRDIFSELLFASLGTMHLVAPYLPYKIKTDFPILRRIQDLISEMYYYHGVSSRFPIFDTPDSEEPICDFPWPSPAKVAIAASPGKDSLWNFMRAVGKYGIDNVLMVHVRNLNKGSNEYKYIWRQQKNIGFKLAVIDLLNSSMNNGYQTMRSRDMFLAGLIIPVALRFGASKIITEGFAEGGEEPFTGNEKNMKFFNKILREIGVPVQVCWENRKEMLIVRDLYDRYPEWMPHVCNCFCSIHRQKSRREFCQRNWPSLELYDSQCGLCVKCRIINIGRILYDSTGSAWPGDIQKFLMNTDAWIKNEGLTTHADMIGGSFMKDFKTACRRYGIKPKSVSV